MEDSAQNGEPNSNAAPVDQAVTAEDVSTIRKLDDQAMHLFWRGASLNMTLPDECTHLDIRVVRAFPLSQPRNFLSICNAKHQEIGMINRLEGMDPANAEALERALEMRYIVPIITQICGIKDQFGFLEWDVNTDRGRTRFTTRNLRDNVIRPSPGRLMFADAEGNRYEIRNSTGLDAKSQSFLLQYL